MASISRGKNGTRTIQFIGADDRRRTLRLGKVSQRVAETIRDHIEELNTAKIMGQSVERRTAAWVADLDDRMVNRLAAVGLIQPRAPEPSATLGPFLDEYVESRADVKPATQEVWSQVIRNLKDHFGVARALDSISDGDADGFKLYLLSEKLAPTTVQKRLQFARMFFRAALRRQLIASNPFAEVSSKAAVRQDRQRYVTREETDRLLEACDPTWRAIVALARYGGLRCPSEVLSVRWADVDWEGGKLLVTSPKTAHHEGKGSRVIPLYPELRAILSEYQTISTAGEYVVAAYRDQALTAKGWRNCNLRTQFNRILKRAGLVPWPRLFHALRASRETELAKDYPLHVVTAWLGNTPKIAMKHYLMTTDADFERAAKSAAESDGNASQGAESSIATDAESAGIADLCGALPDDAPVSSGGQGIRTLNRFPGT
jgi:integrase